MRTVIDGSGADSTAATQAYLNSTATPMIRDLVLIGPPENPNALFLTNHEAPVNYRPYGIFRSAVIKRENVKAEIGLSAQALSISWTPGKSALSSSTKSLATASPYQLAQQHFYDNWPVLVLRCFMPTPGDAETLGCAVWYGGRVRTVQQQRNKLIFNTKSYLDVLTQKVPSTVVEVTNTLASTSPVTLPTGDNSIPVFTSIRPSTNDYIVADCTAPGAGRIYSGNLFAGGYMVFLSGPGATLGGAWSAIGQNGMFTDGNGNHHSEFIIYSPLPWPPTPVVDKFFVSKTPPINVGDEGFFGFPYVPIPTTGV
jgi:hypothetical protein